MARASPREIEMRGHLIDSGILSRVFECIMDLGGEFKVLEMRIGKTKTASSYARLSVWAKSQKALDGILDQAHREGATARAQRAASAKAAPKDMVMPENFYSTTNNRTEVFVGGRWIAVKNMMMDKCIRIAKSGAECVPIRSVRRGDRIIVGEAGVRVAPPERPRSEDNVFEFMSSSSSSERPTQHIARRVAEDMKKIRKDGGKIVLVGGPAIVHTGAADAVAQMVRSGHISAVLAGNALAVHDIEYATLGTSLGMRVKDGSPARRGHRNHMDTINRVFAAGSIAAMVKKGQLRRGIMYECTRKKIPLVLAGSLRDDGPLPDVITDVVEAQRRYKQALKGAKMVMMVSTMLHSIATGNMLPADVKVVVIDISQPTVTKLMDRGTWQALGIVTDVGAFLPMVADRLRR